MFRGVPPLRIDGDNTHIPVEGEPIGNVNLSKRDEGSFAIDAVQALASEEQTL